MAEWRAIVYSWLEIVRLVVGKWEIMEIAFRCSRFKVKFIYRIETIAFFKENFQKIVLERWFILTKYDLLSFGKSTDNNQKTRDDSI